MYQSVTAEEAVKVVESNDKIFVHTAAATPTELLEALVQRADELRNVEVFQLHIEGPAPHTLPEYKGSFIINNMFTGSNSRHVTAAGNGSFMPVFLSEVPLLFRRGIVELDVAMVMVSPPDQHGFCSLGCSVDATRAAVDCAKHVIAVINPQMPRSHGDGLLHIDKLDSFVEIDRPVFLHEYSAPNEIENTIGEHVASLIDDRSCLQMGIGNIPNAVLSKLHNHKDLGIHTEMFSDGVVDLYNAGAITNKYKFHAPGKIVSGFAMGSQKLYDFVDDNPLVDLMDIGWVNDVTTIKMNPKAIAVNSAIEVDLTGQVCADSIGHKIYSGIGGQMDFMRGSALSEGGKAIIALPSQTKKGISRITSTLKPGAGVVTTRAHVHYLVTEYGIAEMYGKNIHQRVMAMIDIAHPDHRARLYDEAKEFYGIHNNVYSFNVEPLL